MPLTFDPDPALTPGLRDGICALWAEVSNAGGAVGFVPPVTPQDVRPELLTHLASMARGRTRLVVGRDGGGAVVAAAFLALNTAAVSRHWCWAHTVLVHPSQQRRGHGRALMAAVGRTARALDGIHGIRLTCRSGLGLEEFYGACGYREVGRVPDGIRVADGGFRDDVTFWLRLRR
ncbi:N-acetyltransferase family protein [Streptomyces sp. bgisy100]|uniref:GNAT family N-acetyltransferase n=1 Tax=Streptomyces sp. bgisy100 TaxID=3413783 RepID=UPI003D721305